MLLGINAVLLCLMQRRCFVRAGEVNDEVVEGLFTSFDSNGDGSIDESKSQHCVWHQSTEPYLRSSRHNTSFHHHFL